MQLTILAEATCPNAPVLTERLATVLGGRADVSVSHQVITRDDEAARWGCTARPHC